MLFISRYNSILPWDGLEGRLGTGVRDFETKLYKKSQMKAGSRSIKQTRLKHNSGVKWNQADTGKHCTLQQRLILIQQVLFRTSVHKSYETELKLMFTELTSREFEKIEWSFYWHSFSTLIHSWEWFPFSKPVMVDIGFSSTQTVPHGKIEVKISI